MHKFGKILAMEVGATTNLTNIVLNEAALLTGVAAGTLTNGTLRMTENGRCSIWSADRSFDCFHSLKIFGRCHA